MTIEKVAYDTWTVYNEEMPMYLNITQLHVFLTQHRVSHSFLSGITLEPIPETSGIRRFTIFGSHIDLGNGHIEYGRRVSLSIGITEEDAEFHIYIDDNVEFRFKVPLEAQ